MGAFEYTVLDSGGKEKKGVLEGDTPRQVRQQLRDRGWIPLSVQEVVQREAKSGGRTFWRRGISASDLALMTRQIATLVRSGLPLEECLTAVSQQSEKTRLRNMVAAVRSRVMEGHPLAVGLAEFPHVFPELYRATVAAGEQSGHLDLVLERLADYTENRQVLKQKIQQATIYPAILTVLSIGIVSFLLAYVVPQVVQVFSDIGQELPLLTRTLIAVSDFLRAYGLALLALLVVAVVAAKYLLKREGPRRQFHIFSLKVPLVSRLVRGINAARFARTFSILTASGVPILEGLRISDQVMSNLPMREAVAAASLRVREGASLNSSLEQSGYFPPMMIHLIASGETSGDLEGMLERAAVNQEREMETIIGASLSLFEPLLIAAMGAIVMVIVLAILLPIFEVNQLVK